MDRSGPTNTKLLVRGLARTRLGLLLL
ncbi:hypothetical protein CCACVL1_30395 [Corchorus capsularis]|uniref:Uncharacterized protein n=1 Tax=Corchorus capsularis TaxID=210143 RepID=A0A1R3FXE1_COCAP|nr:hypothetical protein CCACVL1_30395 [Corchorus capsularis]